MCFLSAEQQSRETFRRPSLLNRRRHVLRRSLARNHNYSHKIITLRVRFYFTRLISNCMLINFILILITDYLSPNHFYIPVFFYHRNDGNRELTVSFSDRGASPWLRCVMIRPSQDDASLLLLLLRHRALWPLQRRDRRTRVRSNVSKQFLLTALRHCPSLGGCNSAQRRRNQWLELTNHQPLLALKCFDL